MRKFDQVVSRPRRNATASTCETLNLFQCSTTMMPVLATIDASVSGADSDSEIVYWASLVIIMS